VGEPFSGQVYSNAAPGGCAPGAGSGPFFVRVGAPLPADAVPLVDVVARGTGRLALRMLESESKRLAAVHFSDAYAPYGDATGPYRDSALGLSCQPVWTTDGEYRCLPGDAHYAAAAWINAFADPACTQRVINTSKLTAVILGARDASGRTPAIEVRRLDTSYTPTAYTLTGSTCSENRRLTGRRLLDGVPLSTYARLDASSP
jgi:hypothetical protein